ncbi:MAG: hypothetical protein ACE5F6_00080 [Anaerolineae bacterium]
MATPKLFNIVKNRKLLNAVECSATRCKESPEGNCPGALWKDPHDVALCSKHMALAHQYSEYLASQPQESFAIVPGTEIEGVQVPPTWLDRAREVITWIQSLQRQAEAVAAAAQGHVIQHQAEMEVVSAELRKTKGTRNQIKQYEDEITSPLKQVLKRIAELTAPTKKAMEQAEGHLRGILSAAVVAEAKRNQELVDQAVEAHATGQDATVATGQMTTSTDLPGVSVKVIWNPIVQDIDKLPDEYVERRPNMAKLKKYVEGFDGREPYPLPGVSFVQDAPLRVRGT